MSLRVVFMGSPDWWRRFEYLEDRRLGNAFQEDMWTPGVFELLAKQRALVDRGRRASGEGFGLVLLEAQLAGTPVVAPAYGGSHDTFIDQVTGTAPADESPEALARVLNAMLSDPDRLARMGQRAGEWARQAFAPDRYAALVVDRLL